MKKLMLLLLPLFVFANCYQPATVKRTTEKPIDVFYSAAPEQEFEELGIVTADFRERGAITGKGSSELLVAKLQDKAAALDADAIFKVNVESEPIPQEMNSIWKASAIAVKFKNSKK